MFFFSIYQVLIGQEQLKQSDNQFFGGKETIIIRKLINRFYNRLNVICFVSV